MNRITPLPQHVRMRKASQNDEYFPQQIGDRAERLKGQRPSSFGTSDYVITSVIDYASSRNSVTTATRILKFYKWGDQMPRKGAVQKRLKEREETLINILAEGKYNAAETERVRRLRKTGINDREWAHIRDKFQFSESARGGINNVIASYWDFRADTHISATLPARIDDVAARSKELRDRLGSLATDPDFYKGVWAYYDQSPMEQVDFFQRLVGDLQKLVLALNAAHHRVKAAPSRPTHRGIWQAVRILDLLMEGQGLRLDAHRNGLAYDVLRLADPKLSPRDILQTLKEFLAARPKWGHTAAWVEHKFR
jgi:hypothetical protein